MEVALISFFLRDHGIFLNEIPAGEPVNGYDHLNDWHCVVHTHGLPYKFSLRPLVGGPKNWGAVVNDSRTLARQLITFTSTTSIDPVHLQGMVHRHIAFVYAMAGRLRHQNTTEQIKPFVFEDEWHSLANRGHQPNLLLLHNLYA